MLGFFAIFFTIYTALNYYIFIRGWQALAIYPHARIFYLVLFLIFSFSYLIAKIFAKYIPAFLYDIILWIGAFWFALMVYFFIAIILIDLIRLFNWQLNFFPASFKENYLQTKLITLFVVTIIVSITVFAGYLNTRNLKVKTLELNLPKGNSALTELNAVMVSDIHLSPINNGPFLAKIVKKINEFNPDIVFVAGDLFDDSAEILRQRNIGSSLSDIISKNGVYAITGNHEYINGIDSAVAFIESYGIKMLRDSSTFIMNSFNLVGREDRAKKQFTGKPRKSLEEIMESVDKNYPVILMDHTPFGLDDAEKNNVALQFSGHTHHGQMFPANLITKMIYEVSWGYLKKGNTQYYVSSGAGTWGPPVRTGSDSEIVHLKIKFVD
jgi:hypothetical protein